MLTQCDLKQRINYNPETGNIEQRLYTSFMTDNSVKIRKDYIKIDKISYTINKIIWLYMTGEVAKGRIYTLNGNKNDKRWKNITRNYNESHDAPKQIESYPNETHDSPKRIEDLTQEILKEYVNYNPDTGVFECIYLSKSVNRSMHRSNNRIGYMIEIEGGVYSARRLAWLYMTGTMSQGKLYMIDGNNKNLKWDNITNKQSESKRKVMETHKRNMSGCVGVVWAKREQRWIAQIKTMGKLKYLGSFKDKADAIAARKIAEIT